MSKHSYEIGCDCARCLREKARREDQARSNPRKSQQNRRPRRTNHSRSASRTEQNARYLDTGPQNWDNIGESPDF